MRRIYFALLCLLTSFTVTAQNDWELKSPSLSLKVKYSTENGSHKLISVTDRSFSFLEKRFSVKENSYYQFSVKLKTSNGYHPYHYYAKVIWLNSEGKSNIPYDLKFKRTYLDSPEALKKNSYYSQMFPEYIADVAKKAEDITLTSTERAPKGAAFAIIQLHHRWAPAGAFSEWSGFEFKLRPAPETRKVRLASAHYRPTRGVSIDKVIEEMSDISRKAAEKKADLLVFGESLFLYATMKKPAEIAGKIPGETSEKVGRIAKKFKMHIVYGQYERDGDIIYNSAVLIDPQGKFIGKYRKVALPPEEAENGVTPDKEFPVFDTKIGKIGMMICYDSFFPDVAKNLALNGAEIIAYPVWGCNPRLAAARACENQVYLISSTYTHHRENWIKSGIFDPFGELLSHGKNWGDVSVEEVDLTTPVYWQGLGEFRDRVIIDSPKLPESVSGGKNDPSANDGTSPILNFDSNPFTAPKNNKASQSVIDGKNGKALQFKFQKESRSTFYTLWYNPKVNWDDYDGFSFWVKGDGSDNFGSITLVDGKDYNLKFAYAFPLKNKEWHKVYVNWKELIPEISKGRICSLDGPYKPSGFRNIWVGRWYYWGSYPEISFSLDDMQLEKSIPFDEKDYTPSIAGTPRTTEKLKSGKPVKILAIGDSLTDIRHWANREVNWPGILMERLKKEFKHNQIQFRNEAIGGSELTQGMVLARRSLGDNPPDLITICYGHNDWTNEMRGQKFKKWLSAAVDRLRRLTKGQSEILLINTCPSVSRWTEMSELAQAVREVAIEKKTGFSELEKAFHSIGKNDKESLFCRDKTHLGPKGHSIVADVVFKALLNGGVHK